MIQRVAARYLQRLLSAAKKKFYPRGPGQKWFRRKQKGRKRTDSRRNYRIKKKQIARQQIKYRRRGIAKMKRKRWLRKFKRNPHKYRYRRGAEMQQIVEKVALRFIQKKKRRYTDKLRDKMRYKKNRSKVKQRGKKHRKKPSVKRRTKKVQKHRQKNPQLHKMRYAQETEMELRNKLIRLAHVNKDLRPHLLPLLKEAALLGKEELFRGITTGIGGDEVGHYDDPTIEGEITRRKIKPAAGGGLICTFTLVAERGLHYSGAYVKGVTGRAIQDFCKRYPQDMPSLSAFFVRLLKKQKAQITQEIRESFKQYRTKLFMELFPTQDVGDWEIGIDVGRISFSASPKDVQDGQCSLHGQLYMGFQAVARMEINPKATVTEPPFKDMADRELGELIMRWEAENFYEDGNIRTRAQVADKLRWKRQEFRAMPLEQQVQILRTLGW